MITVTTAPYAIAWHRRHSMNAMTLTGIWSKNEMTNFTFLLVNCEETEVLSSQTQSDIKSRHVLCSVS